jgi:hypothetical protein
MRSISQQLKKLKHTQIEFANKVVKFICIEEQGKPNLKTYKINQVLVYFGHSLTSKPLSGLAI